MTANELERNLRQVLERMARDGEEIVVERNRREIARIVPSPARQTALEAMADLYGVLPHTAGASWERERRRTGLRGERIDKGVRNPWES